MEWVRRGVMAFSMTGLCAALAMQAWSQPGAPAVAPDRLHPEFAQIYWSYAGATALGDAWTRTAAADSLEKSGFLEAAMRLLEANGPREVPLADWLRFVGRHGASFSSWLERPVDGAEPDMTAVVVWHEASMPSIDVLKAMTGGSATEEQAGNRNVVRMPMGDVSPETTMWLLAERGHLVSVIGAKPDLERVLAHWKNKGPSILEGRLGKARHLPGAMIEAWCDVKSLFSSLREAMAASKTPPKATLDQVLGAFGLDRIDHLAISSTPQGRLFDVKVDLETPAPHRGLLKLIDQGKLISLAELPPLPKSVRSISAGRFDPSTILSEAESITKDVAKFDLTVTADGVAMLLAAVDQQLGLSIRSDIFESLGSVSCMYEEAGVGMPILRTAIAHRVTNSESLKAALRVLIQRAQPALPQGVSITEQKAATHSLWTFAMANVPIQPTLVVDNDWLVIAPAGNIAKNYLANARTGKANWKPSKSQQQSIDLMPRGVHSLTLSEPADMIRNSATMLPLVLPQIEQAGGPKAGQIEQLLEAANFPDVDDVAEPLTTASGYALTDDTGYHSLSRSPLPIGSLDLTSTGGAAAPVVVALLLPAVQQARSAARRAQSMNNLKQIGLALHNFHDVHQAFPQGAAPVEGERDVADRFSWQAQILPFVEQAALYQQLDMKAPLSAAKNADAVRAAIPVYRNPHLSAPPNMPNACDYAGVAGLTEKGPFLKVREKGAGMFAYDRKTQMRDITDGTSNTLMVGEVSNGRTPWSQAGPGSIRPIVKAPGINVPGGFGGAAPGGCNFLLGDGSVRFVSEKIDARLMESLTTIAGGEVINGF